MVYMTRKDYVLLAAALQSAATMAQTDPNKAVGVKMATDAIVAALATDNPQFDAKKFHKAAAPLI